MHAAETTFIPAAEQDVLPATSPTRASLPVPSTTTPATLLTLAIQQNADLDRLEKLMALQERWEANEARKAYVAALASFKGEPLEITKDKRVYFESKNGGSATDYRHATLGNVVGIIAPALARHGLSHSWTPMREGDRVKVRCTLTHAMGHSESVEMEGPLDNSGNKNPIQQQASTVTFLERYTLLAITGVAVLDQDNDGAGGGYKVETITEEQAAKLQDALEATGRNVEKFKAWLHVEKLSDVTTENFEHALREASKPKASKG